MFMCMISVLVIALSLWFENEDNLKEEIKANPGNIEVDGVLDTYLNHVLKILIVFQWIIYTSVNSRLLYKWVSISLSFELRNMNTVTLVFNVFTESAPRPIQSQCLYVSVSGNPATRWTGDFWSKSVSLILTYL